MGEREAKARGKVRERWLVVGVGGEAAKPTFLVRVRVRLRLRLRVSRQADLLGEG